MAAPVLDLETTIADKVKTLLASKAELASIQMLMPEEDTQLALPLIRLQVEVVGPSPGLEGSAMVGIWNCLVWVTVIVQRADATDDQLRTLFGHVRDTIYGERDADYAEIDSSLFKVWNIEFQQTVYQRDDTHDSRTLPMLWTCAAFSSATT